MSSADAISLQNNFRAIRAGRFPDAEKAKFVLSKMKEKTGTSEQKLIIDLILSGYELSPAYEPLRSVIDAEWELCHSSSEI